MGAVVVGAAAAVDFVALAAADDVLVVGLELALPALAGATALLLELAVVGATATPEDVAVVPSSRG